jgi:hypothetical protein
MISHHLRILELALASLLHHKARYLCIIVIYSFEVFILASALFTGQALKQEAMNLLAESPSIIVQKMSGGRHSLIPLSTAGIIAGIPGVNSIIPRIWGYYYDPPSQTHFTLTSAGVLGPEPGEIIEGRLFTAEDPFGCVIGKGIAELRLLDIGDLLPVKGDDGNLYGLRVTGIFRANSQLLTNDLIVLSEENLRLIFQIPETMATDFAVNVPNEGEINTVGRKIIENLNAVRVISRSQILRTYEAVFSWRSGLLLLAFAGCLAAFTVLAWDKASGLNTEEKKNIGILRALGWEVSEVLEFRFWDGFAISFISFLSGVSAAYLHVFFFGCGLFEPILKGWSVLFPGFQLVPNFEPFILMAVFFMSVVPYTFATLVPCWSISVTDPDLAMRG